MKRIINTRIGFFLMLFVSGSVSAQLDTTLLRDRSVKIFENFRTGNYQPIIDQMDSSLRARMDSARLHSAWVNLQKRAGTFVKVTDITADHQAYFSVVLQHCQFTEKKIIFKLVFGKYNALKGLSFMPDEPMPRYQLPPYYKEELITEIDTVVSSGNVRLPAVFTVPKAKGRYPAVILIHGSGPNDRDETFGPLKMFKDLALGLSAQGIAVLRYDKRTHLRAAQLTIVKRKMTVKEETMDDAIAAVAMLKKNPLVDSTRIFLVGHGLGAYLLPRIAEQAKALKGIILLGGNPGHLEDVFMKYYESVLNMDSISPKREQTLDSIKSQVTKVKQLTEANRNDSAFLFQLPVNYWLDLKTYDPIKSANSISQQMLVLQGERDFQVTMEDYNGWVNGLKGRKNFSFKSYPKLNHFFVEGEGPSNLAEYRKYGYVSKEVIDDITNWIKSGKLK